MIIIIEGPNMTTKSSLVKKLSKSFNLKIIKESKPPIRDGFEYYIKRISELEDNIVLDRFHLGEYVYPILMKDDRKPLAHNEQNYLENLLIKKKAILIKLDATQEFKERIFDTRGEDFIKKDMIKEESLLFNVAYERSIMKKVSLIVDNYSYPDLMHMIIKFNEG